MALLNDILRWTQASLTLWQRDAARRLFQHPEGISGQDYDEIYALMLASHGLPNPKNLLPAPLAATHLPSTTSDVPPVCLTAMHDLQHINRIATGQTLTFSPTGISVIYGGNGSGKSGYARVLKRACRARDQVEKVLPDASIANAHTCIPKAKISVQVGSTSKTVEWSAIAISPDDLSTIAVFDSHCARAYLTAEQDIAYLPYGLDVVEDLANKVLPELNRRLEQSITSINVDVEAFQHLVGETTVGSLVAALSDKTDPLRVRQLAVLTQEQTERIEELNSALAEADPRAKAKGLRLSAHRLKEFQARVKAAQVWVDDKAIEVLSGLDCVSVIASEAEKAAAEHFRSGEALLSGTGDPIWKALYDAARKFSVEVVYPDQKFPHVEQGALCLLCQQPVEAASERLKRFEQFVKEDAARVAEEKRLTVSAAASTLKNANLSFGFDRAIADELESFVGGLSGTVREFEKSVGIRRDWMLESVKSHAWENRPDLGDNPRQQIRDLAAKQFKGARTLEKAADEVKSKKLKTERDELKARQNLGACVNAVLALIERMKLKRALDSCRKDLKTKPISDKSKEFASSAVTEALKKALEEEFTALGIGHIKTRLKERNDKGKMMYRLLLDLPSGHKLEDVLSEGEQRAIALGSFLAELRLANHAGGIVFDDPVSSLDHQRRQNVAKRIVKEAKLRQVVVFTHDTSFLGEIRDAIEQNGVDHALQYLEWAGDRPGHVSDGLPWGHKSYRERIGQLERAQKALEKRPWPTYPNESESGEMRRQYNHFRATIERVIQDVVFNGVVRRYRDWIRVDSLADVVGFEESECKEIVRLHQRCNDVVDAHDPASQKNPTVPTAKELGEDLDALKTVIAAIQDRRSAAKGSKSAASSS